MKISEATILVLDVETTGLDVEQDQVIELGGCIITAGSIGDPFVTRIKPIGRILGTATAIHGISDEDVADCQPFSDVAGNLVETAAHVDAIGGYNAAEFDLPMLNAELRRAMVAERLPAGRLLDPFIWLAWFEREESGKLTDACERYGVTLDGAHSAGADAEATAELLLVMVDMGVLPDDVDAALAEQADMRQHLDAERVKWAHYLYQRPGDVVRVGFGRHRGDALSDTDQRYVRWCLDSFAGMPAAVVSAMEGAS